MLANTLFRWFIAMHYRNMKRWLHDPHGAQAQVWQELIESAGDTEWGRKYRFKDMESVADFQATVPISEYDDLKPYIERMMLGEADILWHGVVQRFSKSSGTTSDKSKFIPVSDENLDTCHLKGGHDIMAAWYHNNPYSKLYKGKLMALGGTHKPLATHPDTVVGDVSAIMLDTMPFYAKYFFAPTLDVALMDKWEDKIEQMAQQLVKENITMMSGVPTWTLVLLRRISEITGKQNLLEIWPNFEYYAHGGVSFEPYRAQFRHFLPEKVRFINVYNASEGFFAAQLDNEGSDMTLLLDNGTFYEFVPIDELEKPKPKALQLHEVSLDTNYALVISTNAGLWRYLVGDTVRFTSLKPYKIQISGRTKHFINVFGEEVMVENTDRALAQTCQELGGTINEYTVGPIFMEGIAGKGGHEWVIEFNTEPANLSAFAETLDKNLQHLNSDYEAKRYQGIALQALKLNTVPIGTFHTWLRNKGKYGGQHKVPRLSNSRKYLEDILKIGSV